MAYTRVWDNSAPPGTALANTIDTIFQEFRQDTQQRISSILAAGTDIDTDPLQLKPSALGAVTGAVKVFNPHAIDGILGYTLPAGAFTISDAIPIAINARITRVRAFVDRQGGASCRVRLLAVNPITPAVTVVSDLGNAPIGFTALDSTPFGVPYQLGTTQFIYGAINGNAAGGSVKFYGWEITYDIAAGEVIP